MKKFTLPPLPILCFALLALMTGWLSPLPQLPAQFAVPGAPSEVLTARAEPPAGGLALGRTAMLSVKLRIKKPYHVNANPATEDYLIPTVISLASSGGLSFGKPIYPKAENKKFAFADKPLAVYEDEVTVRVPVTAAKSAKPGARKLNGTVRYQACDDNNCLIPTTASFTVALNVAKAGAGSSSGTVGANATTPPAGATGQTGGASTTSSATSDASAGYAMSLREQYAVPGLPTIVFLDKSGRERTDLRAGEELTHAAMLRKLGALKSGARLTANAGEETGAAGWMEKIKNASLWWQLALVFGGGLLLNLTPCVYPMIPITVGYFGAQSEGRFGKTLGLALLYVLGLALVYSSLGVSAALTGSLFGSLLQSPFAVGLVALVLGAFALSMMGLFTIQPPQFLMSRSGAKKGALGALGMGALLGIVAAPCVGPVVAALLTYVGAKADPLLGFALFFALSLGLGLPYLLLGVFSGSVKALPKSGMWLERSKKIFAVPLLVAALYYGYSAVKLASSPTQAQASEQVTLAAGGSDEKGPIQTEKPWPPATSAAIDAARRAGRPVVLDFRADWCLPCLKMEREIFSRPDVLRAADGVTLLQVDLTRAGS